MSANPPPRTIHVKSLGCQMNVYDGKRMVELLTAEGRRHAAVVSGLALLNFPDEDVERIIAAAFAASMPDPALYQFTYGPKCPVSKAIRAELGLSAQRTTHIWRNVPPASVYRIVRD